MWVNRLTFAPDGGRLTALCGDGMLRAWDCASGRELRIGEGGALGPRWPSRLSFAPDGRSLLVVDNEAWVAELISGQRRARLSLPPGPPLATAWSPDGTLVACSQADGMVRLFVAATGQEVVMRERAEQIHEGKPVPVLAPAPLHDELVSAVTSMAFSPDGRLLACGGHTGLITVWKVPALPPPAPSTALRRAALWDELGHPEAGAAGRALAALTEAPGPAVELFRQRLRQGEAHADPRRLEKLIAELDNDDFVVREQAQKELAAAGSAAVDALRQALAKDPSPEVRRRLQRLLAPYDRPGTQPARLRAVRAVEVLERIGTPPARRLLQDLVGKVGDAVVEQEIKDSLRRLDERK
jgi:hypothetical protein